MYSDNKIVNELTALLRRHGVTTAVVCPGSRNAPIVRNLAKAGYRCVSVVDERSAGFYALGLALAERRPVVVCVTSGSAVLNLAPAIAEAAYRNVPVVVVSADRPASYIGHYEGQTIPQPGVLRPFVRKSVDLPETDTAYANMLINKAMMATKGPSAGPVHINVPLDAPLFGESVAALPEARVIRILPEIDDKADITAAEVAKKIKEAARPMIVIGQMARALPIGALSKKCVVLCEPLSDTAGGCDFDTVLEDHGDDEALYPDFVVYIGGNIVSNRLKTFLKKCGAEVWTVSADGDVHDPSRRSTVVVTADSRALAGALTDCLETCSSEFAQRWNALLAEARIRRSQDELPFGSQWVVRELESHTDLLADCSVHYANSSVVRWANMYARHYIYVNRGVNGIEGSVSTAAGFSLAAKGQVLLVTGDLSFFYDSNALWCGKLDGRLRILLINDGGGAIFGRVAGMPQDATTHQYVSACHNAGAEGICHAYDVKYLRADSPEQTAEAIKHLLAMQSERPVLLEVTDDG